MPKKEEIYLPPGLELSNDDEKQSDKEHKNSIRYPTKQFYAEYNAICTKLDFFVNEVSIAMITDFVNRNRHVLKQDWKKPKKEDKK